MQPTYRRDPTIRPLRCPNCGAPLRVPADGVVARCEYCGAEHRFFRTALGQVPPQAPAGRYGPGQSVLIQWGDAWWPGRVLRCLPEGRYEVHYDGWSAQWDEVVGADRLALPGEVPLPAPRARTGRSAGCAFAAGALTVIAIAVAFLWPEDEPPATPTDAGTGEPSVISSPVAPVQIDFDRAAEEPADVSGEEATDVGEEVVGGEEGDADAGPPGRPLESGAALEPGDPVWAFSEKRWYRAEIVRRVRRDRYTVHFPGYDERYDETLPADRLRLRDDNVPPSESASAAPGRPVTSGVDLARGDAVWAYSEDDWHRAEVVRRVGPGRYLVRFIGYDERFDETLTASSLRLRDD